MSEADHGTKVNQHYSRLDLSDRILAALEKAGKQNDINIIGFDGMPEIGVVRAARLRHAGLHDGSAASRVNSL